MPDAGLVEALRHMKRYADELRESKEPWDRGRASAFDDACIRIKAALTQSPLPREGEWVTVPREPSVEQLNAARDWSLRVNGQGVGNAQATGCYQAMLAAAPPSPDRQGAMIRIPQRRCGRPS